MARFSKLLHRYVFSWKVFWVIGVTFSLWGGLYRPSWPTLGLVDSWWLGGISLGGVAIANSAIGLLGFQR